jgi:endoglucanase
VAFTAQLGTAASQPGSIVPGLRSQVSTGTAALSATGSLAVAAVPAPAGAVTLSATGGLGAAAVPAVPVARALTATGTLTVPAPAPGVPAAPALAATGTLTAAAGTVSTVGAAVLSASGTLAAVGAPSVGALTDDFTTQDTAKWSGWSADAFVTAGRLVVNCTPAYPGISSVSRYGLAGSALTAQIVGTPVVGDGTTETLLIMLDAAGSRVQITAGNGLLYLVRYLNGAQVDAPTVPYDPTAMAWWRLRESAGTIYWETAPDGLAWTVQRSVAGWAGFDTSAATVTLASGYYGTNTSPGSATFDNVNVTPAALAFSGTASLAGTGSLAVAATPALTGAVPLAGTGALNAAGAPAVAPAPILTGTGQLAASGTIGGLPAVALVAQTASTTTTGNPKSLTIPAAGVGNLLVLHAAIQSTTITVSSVTDNGGGTWVRAVGLAASSREEIWYRSAPAGAPTTVTATTSTAGTLMMIVSEWSGIDLASALLNTASSTTAASPNTTGAETAGTAGDLIIAGFAVNSATARTITVGTELVKPTLPSSFNTAGAYLITGDTSAHDIQWTTASAASTAGVSALFKAGGAAPSAPVTFAATGSLTVAGIGTAPGLVTLAATGSLAPAAAPAFTGTTLVRRGVASSGGEFSPGTLPGTYGTTYHYDSAGTLTYLAARGHKAVRLALQWERIQRSLSGALDATEMGRVDTYITNAAAAGLGVILDVHNYARYNSGAGAVALGSAGGPTQADLVDLWTRLSARYAGNAGVIGYGLMNEPHDLTGGAAQWEAASQACVSAIRAAGDTTTLLVPGYSFAGAQTWTTNHAAGWITDPAGAFLYEAHHYWDGNHSGTYTSTYATEVVAAETAGWTAGAYPDALTNRTLSELASWVSWLNTNGARGFVGEMGWPRRIATHTGDYGQWSALGQAWYQAADAAGLWVTYWSTSEWWGSYPLSLYDTSGGPLGVANEQAAVVEAHPQFTAVGVVQALSATGTLGVAGTLTAAGGAVALSATGQLTGAVTVAVAGPVTLAATGTLAVVGSGGAGLVPLTATGTLVAAPTVPGPTGTAGLAATGTLAVAETGAAAAGTVALGVTGALTLPVRTPVAPGAAALAASGALTVAAVVGIPGQGVVLAATGSLGVVSTSGLGAATLTATGSLAVTVPNLAVAGTVTLAGVGALPLAASGSLAVAGVPTPAVPAALAATGSLVVAVVAGAAGAGALSVTGSLVVLGGQAVPLLFTATGTLAVPLIAQITGTAALTGNGLLAMSATRPGPTGTAALGAAGVLAAALTAMTAGGAVTLTAAGFLGAVVGLVAAAGTAGLGGSGLLAVVGLARGSTVHRPSTGITPRRASGITPHI